MIGLIVGILIFILVISVLFGIGGLIVYLITQRLEEKKNETFEKRDN